LWVFYYYLYKRYLFPLSIFFSAFEKVNLVYDPTSRSISVITDTTVNPPLPTVLPKGKEVIDPSVVTYWAKSLDSLKFDVWAKRYQTWISESVSLCLTLLSNVTTLTPTLDQLIASQNLALFYKRYCILARMKIGYERDAADSKPTDLAWMIAPIKWDFSIKTNTVTKLHVLADGELAKKDKGKGKFQNQRYFKKFNHFGVAGTQRSERSQRSNNFNSFPKEKFLGNCRYCGKQGHKERDCRVKKGATSNKSQQNPQKSSKD